MVRKFLTVVATVAAVAAMTPVSPVLADTLDNVKTQGFVRCGVTGRQPGFSERGADGVWRGLNIDMCRAVAAATLGNADAVDIKRYWLEALSNSETDVLIASSTWTLERDAGRDLRFTGPIFYDGQGFIAHKSLGARSAKEVKKATVCAVVTTATTGRNLADYIEQNDLDWQIVPQRTLEGMWGGFIGRQCDMATHDRTALVAKRAGGTANPDDYVVFPEVISKEPLSPVVRGDDKAWVDIVRWTVFATFAAEELGVTSANVDDMLRSDNPEIRRLLGVEGELGPYMGLDKAWAYRVIKTVGNYGEIFDRAFGADTPFKLSRGLNGQWRDGGLIYAPPFR